MSRRSSVRWTRWGALLLMIALVVWMVTSPAGVEDTPPTLSSLTSTSTSTRGTVPLPSPGTVVVPSMPPLQWNATTEDGSPTGWQFGLVPMWGSPRYARMLISHPSLSSRGECATYTSGKAPLKRPLHPAAEQLAENAGPDYFEAFINTAWPEVVAVSLTFRLDVSSCVYESIEGVALPPSETSPPSADSPIGLTTFIYVTHVHAHYDGINELVEGAHYPYVRSAASRRIFPRLAAIASGPSYIPLRYDRVHEVYRIGSGYQATPQPPQPPIMVAAGPPPPYWVASRPDPHYCRHHIDGAFKGYYLSYKGFKGAACKLWGPRGHASLVSMDLLGRLDYGAAYHYGPHVVDTVRRRLVAAAGDDATLRRRLPPGCSNLLSTPIKNDPVVLTKECIVSLVGGGGGKGAHTIYFVGDSHMRLFFYGFLSRMGISYPHDKVWRGDRSDTISGTGGTTMRVKFVASYFLNLTKDSAASMLAESMGDATSTVVAGVGQHHTSNCWSLAKDRAVVEEALSLLGGRPIVWFGIPAQPFNAHLSVPKPVGQSRKDCRNNQRHEFVNAMQKELVAAVGVPYIDTMSMTRGMAHTSLDGAHFYTWPRAAWIDELVLLMLERHLADSK